ncbi:MAG: hypothetical protein CUN53_02465 [Phototrophicales bacterium]|nr:MAG: hypothetical protein CUN53_02465 [Phototrophicales bacterium]
MIVALLLGCASPGSATLQMPTLMMLPSDTPTAVPTPTPTINFLLTAEFHLTSTAHAELEHLETQTASAPTATATQPPTDTPDAMLTEFALLAATNRAAQATISALAERMDQTNSAPTPTEPPDAPVLTPTVTETPTPTPDPVITMPMTILFARLPADLYRCPARVCDRVTRLDIGTPMIADGMIQGEAVDGVNALWYRLNYNGSPVYVYSSSVTAQPPTAIPLPGAGFESTQEVQMPPVCPRNCREAVAWGLSAQQAALCGLDRDGDGVACYGD